MQEYTNNLLNEVGDVFKAIPFHDNQFTQAEVDEAIRTLSLLMTRDGALEVTDYDFYTRLYDLIERINSFPETTPSLTTVLESVAILQRLGLIDRSDTSEST